MATTQKRSGGGRSASSGGKRTTSAARSKPASKSSRADTSSHRPFRREVGAVGLPAPGDFLLLWILQNGGDLHHLLCGAGQGTVGYGFWLVPPALLLGAYILAFHRGRPVRLRLTCALLLPLMVAAYSMVCCQIRFLGTVCWT